MDNENEKAIVLYFSKVMPEFLQANECLVQVDESAKQAAVNTYNTANIQKNVVTVILIGLSAATFTITILMARFIVASIIKPIKEIEKAAKEMAQGSLKTEIVNEGQDEMGSMADSMRTLTQNTSDIVKDIGVILGNLADGNFRVKSRCLEHYRGDYRPIVEAMRLICDNLSQILLEINESTQQVHSRWQKMRRGLQKEPNRQVR